jgi:hypothetical protein
MMMERLKFIFFGFDVEILRRQRFFKKGALKILMPSTGWFIY